MESTLTKNQVFKISGSYVEGKNTFEVRAEFRFDDKCGNGYNTFAVTADVYRLADYNRYEYISGGCCHDDVAKALPQYAHLIKWHLCDTTGPMHYIANTVYHAGDRDYNGLRKGEFKQIKNGKTGLPCWKLVVDAPSYIDQEGEPAPVVCRYVPFGRIGEGKERDFKAARSCAIWPEATDEELSSDNLKEKLMDRHPQLMADFRKDMEDFGFTW